MNKYFEKMSSLKSYYVQDGEPRLLSEGELQRIEDKIGHNLPGDYRDFVSEFGCYAAEAYAVFSFKEPFSKGNEGIVSVFYGVFPDDVYDLIYNYETYQQRIAIDALPIAMDPGGNQICIALCGPGRGRIYFWDHSEELASYQGKSNLYSIADSFDEFMNSLTFQEA